MTRSFAGAGTALVTPFTKTGGLGDVSAALPSALRACGIDVRVLLPGYPATLRSQTMIFPASMATSGMLSSNTLAR